MPSPRPSPEVPGFVDGQLVTQAQLNALGEHAALLFDWTQGGFRTRKPMVEVRSTGGTITGATAFVTWQQVGANTDAMYGSVVTSGVFVNTPGVYLCESHLTLGPAPGATTANAYLQQWIMQNSNQLDTDAVAADYAAYPASLGGSSHCSAVVPLSYGVIMRVAVRHTAGTGAPLITTNGGCRFTMEWLGPLESDEESGV